MTPIKFMQFHFFATFNKTDKTGAYVVIKLASDTNETRQNLSSCHQRNVQMAYRQTEYLCQRIHQQEQRATSSEFILSN